MAHEVAVEDCLAAVSPQLDSAAHLYVGYSGGLDSHVLLKALVDVVGVERVTAIHVNHQLSPRSRQWADHCQQICAVLGVDYLCRDVSVSPSASTENAAREARYKAYTDRLGAGDILLLAHHADDQAETVLYRLLRRSGPRGLAGMPASRPLGAGRLLRPFLSLNREALHQYALNNGLSWIEDESNRSRQFDRNYLRLEIVPGLRSRWPDYAKRIAASAMLCEQAEVLSEDLARLDLNSLALRTERCGWSIEIPPLLALTDLRKANVLRFVARSRGFAVPGHHVIGEVTGSLLNAEADRNPVVAWSGGQWRRFRQRLFLLPQFDNKVDSSLMARTRSVPWAVEDKLKLADGAILSAESARGEGLAIKWRDALTVTLRQGGERCRPVGRGGSASLKKLFQEYALEPWLRPRVPLVYCAGELAAVGDLWVCEGFQAAVSEPGYQLCWRYDVDI